MTLNVKLTIQECELLATLASDQLFRRSSLTRRCRSQVEPGGNTPWQGAGGTAAIDSRSRARQKDHGYQEGGLTRHQLY